MPSPPFALTSARSSTSLGTFIVHQIVFARNTSGSIRLRCSAAGRLAPNTVTQRLAALRFLYIQVLKRGWSVAETPYPKKVLHLPQILSQQEVARVIDATETPFQRILVMTLYATGARRAEVAHLKVTDIDSERMVVHIRAGKGGKDRDVVLSPALLEELRTYWRGLRRKPTDWLFPGNRWHTATPPVTTKVLWTACQQAALRAGFEHKHIHPHTLCSRCRVNWPRLLCRTSGSSTACSSAPVPPRC